MNVRRRNVEMSNLNKKMQLMQQNVEKISDIPEISIPGIQNLYKPVSKIRKISWFTALSICVFIALFQVKDRIGHLINGSIAVRISVDHNNKVDLPNITFCPPMDYNRSDDISALMKIYERKLNKNATSIFDLMELPGINVSLLWGMTKLSRSGFLIKSFNQTITSNFTYDYFPSIYGTCVTIHKKEPFPTFLLPELFFEFTDTHWTLPNPRGLNCTKVVSAYKIILHSRPLTLYDIGVQGHRVFGFSLLTLHYKIIRYSFLNDAKTPCTEDPNKFHECRAQCLNDLLKQHIPCRLPYHSIPDKPICNDRESSISSNETTYKILSEFKWDRCRCSQLCSGLSFSTSKDLGWMVSNKKSFLRVRMNFQDATVDKISEYRTYTLVSLLCDVGASLGLMLGMCILTFIQIIEVVVYFVYNMFKKKKKGSVNNKRVMNVVAISDY